MAFQVVVVLMHLLHSSCSGFNATNYTTNSTHTINITTSTSTPTLWIKSTQIYTNVPTIISPNTFSPSMHPTGIHLTTTVSGTTTDIILVMPVDETDENNAEHFVKSLIVVIAVVVVVLFIFIPVPWCVNSFVYDEKGCDSPHYWPLLWVFVEIIDFISDLSLWIYLLYLWNDNTPSIIIIFVASTIFFYGSYIANLIYLWFRLSQWKRNFKSIRSWLNNNKKWLLCITCLIGGAHQTIELCNSLLFPIDIFAMNLITNEIILIRADRIKFVMFTSFASFIIQIMILSTVNNTNNGRTVVYIGIISTILSITCVIYYFIYIRLNGIVISLASNHNWSFQITLISSEIKKYQKYSFLNLRKELAVALELEDNKWITIEDIEYYYRLQGEFELHCKGCINIPYECAQTKPTQINNNEYVNEDEIADRIEALKNKQSQYHITFKQQMRYRFVLSKLTVNVSVSNRWNNNEFKQQQIELQMTKQHKYNDMQPDIDIVMVNNSDSNNDEKKETLAEHDWNRLKSLNNANVNQGNNKFNNEESKHSNTSDDEDADGVHVIDTAGKKGNKYSKIQLKHKDNDDDDSDDIFAVHVIDTAGNY